MMLLKLNATDLSCLQHMTREHTAWAEPTAAFRQPPPCSAASLKLVTEMFSFPSEYAISIVSPRHIPPGYCSSDAFRVSETDSTTKRESVTILPESQATCRRLGSG